MCLVCLVCALARACVRACEQVRIANYIAGGVLDNTWRSVVIPLSALATTAWNLGDVETLSFGNTSAGCTIAADGTRPRPQCEDLLLTNLTLLLVGPPPSPLCAIAVTEFNGGSPPTATQEGLFGGRAVRGLARPLPAPCGVPRPMFYR